MLYKIKTATIVLVLLLISNNSFSQHDSTTKATGSLHNDFLISQSILLQKMESARMQDSLKRIKLQQEISGLATADNAKKQDLLKELDLLKNKDKERIILKKIKIDSLRQFIKGYAVVPFLKDTLFSIYNKLGSFSAKDRAESISKRIYNLTTAYFFKTDSLLIIPAENTVDIVFRETIVMSISENDALWQNNSKENLAKIYKAAIGNAVINYNAATSWQSILKQFGLAILVLSVLYALISFLNKTFRFTKAKIILQKDKSINGIKIRNYELLTASRLLHFFLTLNSIVKWFLIILTIYLTLPILFSIFPWTEGFANTLLSYFLNPVKNIFFNIWNYLPDLFTIIVIVTVFRYVIKGANYLKTEIETGALTLTGFYADWATPTFVIIKVLLYAFMFVLIWPYLPGSDSQVFKGVSVFLGVLFTFGSSGSLSNVIAGLVLTYMRVFKIGDRVKIADVTGDIIEKSLLVTRIRTIKNEIISIPNSNVISSHTINYSSDSLEKGLILHTTVTIGYDVPWKTIHRALLDAADRTEFIMKDIKPFVLQTSLEDFYVAYQLNAYTKEPNKQAIIYSQLHQNIQDCCNEAGIEIMSPHYRAARDGNLSTIPAEYLSKDYKVPSFNVKLDKDEK